MTAGLDVSTDPVPTLVQSGGGQRQSMAGSCISVVGLPFTGPQRNPWAGFKQRRNRAMELSLRSYRPSGAQAPLVTSASQRVCTGRHPAPTLPELKHPSGMLALFSLSAWRHPI